MSYEVVQPRWGWLIRSPQISGCAARHRASLLNAFDVVGHIADDMPIISLPVPEATPEHFSASLGELPYLCSMSPRLSAEN
jgi:hypothetical protein